MFSQTTIKFTFLVGIMFTIAVGCCPKVQQPVMRSATAQARPASSQQAKPASKQLKAKPTSCDQKEPMLKDSDQKIASFLACMQKDLQENGNPEVRARAAEMLAYGGLPQAKVLIKYLILEQDLEVRRSLVRGLAAMGERINPVSWLHSTMIIRSSGIPAETAPIMWDDEGVKIQALVVPVLIGYAQNADTAEIRGEAAHALGRFQDRTATPVLEAIALKKNDPYARRAAMTALGSRFLVPSSVTPAMRIAATDPDPVIRSAVAQTLSSVGTPEAMRILIEMVDKAASDDVREWYRIGLESQGSPVVLNVLEEAFIKYGARTKLDILYVLKTCSPHNGTGVLSILQKLSKVEKDSSFKPVLQEVIEHAKKSIEFKKLVDATRAKHPEL